MEVNLELKTGEVVKVEAEHMPSLPSNLRFSQEMGTMICDLVREGLSYKEVARRCGIPASSIHSWKRTHEKFAEELYLARKDGADTFAHRVQEIADMASIEKDAVPGLRLQSDLYKWLAEKADPGQYGSQTKITGDENSPLKIIVDTGIRREDPPQIEEGDGGPGQDSNQSG